MTQHTPITLSPAKRSILVNGHRVAYIDQGSGFPVLLGHSYLWDSEMWRPQIDVLSQHFRVLAPDLWGHGQSDALPPDTQDLDGLARQHAAFLDALNISQCHVVGMSVGGMWGARLAMHAPQRVDRLVLMATDLGSETDMARIRYAQILERIDETGRLDPAALGVVTSLCFHPNGRTIPAHRRAFAQRLLRYDPATLSNSVVPLGRMIFGRADILGQVAELNPEHILIICGERDTPRPPAESRIMADVIGCRYVLVPDAGHIMNLEKPNFVNDTLIAWLLPPSQKKQLAVNASRVPPSLARPH